MSETTAAVDGPDATIVTKFVYNETNSETTSWKFCNNLTLPRFELVFVAQIVVILILLTFCNLKPSVWFLISSDLVGHVLPNPSI